MIRLAERLSIGILLSLGLSTLSLAQQATVEDLLKACSRKTDVWERVDGKLVRVGQKLDSYCEGYLSGSFFTLLVEGKVCLGDHSSRPEYLESVFRLHASRSEIDPSQEVAVPLKEAFTRAYPCKR